MFSDMQISPLLVLYHTYYSVSKEGIGTARALFKRVIRSDHFTCKCFLRVSFWSAFRVFIKNFTILDAFNQLNVPKKSLHESVFSPQNKTH